MKNDRSLMAVTRTRTHKLCKLEDKTSSAILLNSKKLYERQDKYVI